ncbi:hypothetical protein BJ684DRAFT_17028 [Piptocephalis cylindrospora]|uniref:Cyclin-D1-binding protein 1-like N-terminal domain-containing protein n=1 Tax=Piptocephalis cylindrospora TaxID=1907219 RepID=A0A4P9Y147_9FUNG|nr:hypothetical protein BJ684DRAFT_17028 [Piptocephalis cylindrospora]|eukprot:RKP12488.1 hypothetical protein BJ684DRAFT_17028 [Piptocephalis cylindrospora]
MSKTWKEACAALQQQCKADVPLPVREETSTEEIPVPSSVIVVAPPSAETAYPLEDMLQLARNLKEVIVHHVAKIALALSTQPETPAPTEPLLVALREHVEKLQNIPSLVDPEVVGLFLVRRIRVVVTGMTDAIGTFAQSLPSTLTTTTTTTSANGMTLPQLVGQVKSACDALSSLPSIPKQGVIERVQAMLELVEDARSELNDMLDNANDEQEGKEEEEEEEEDDFFGEDVPTLSKELRTALIQILPVIRLSGLILRKATSKTLPLVQGKGRDGAWLDGWVDLAEGISQTVDEVAGVFWGEGEEDGDESEEEKEEDAGVKELKVRMNTLLGHLEQPVLLLDKWDEPLAQEHRAWYDRCWKEARRMVEQDLGLEAPGSKSGVKRAA